MSHPPSRIRRLKHIEAFSAVISTGSISGAARQLGVSQPAVSQLIKALEDAIGAPLFVRRNGAIFPTSRAEILREDAISLLAQLDRFQAQLSHQRTGLLSTIRLSASMSLATELLPPLVEKLTDIHPDLKFYMSSVPLNAMITSLVQGNIDFALHSRPFDYPGLHSEKLASSRQVAILPADHDLAGRDSLTIRDFDGCRFIGSTKSDPSYHEVNSLCSRAKISMNTVFQTPFASVAIKMVQPMRAVTFSNEAIARLMLTHTSGIVMRDVTGVELTTAIFLACAEWQADTETQRLIKNAIAGLNLHRSAAEQA